jgi:hypothetical protein
MLTLCSRVSYLLRCVCGVGLSDGGMMVLVFVRC